MIELIISFLIVLAILLVKKNTGLCILVFLLPFHSFLKGFISYNWGGGEIFSFWKEIAIFIYFVRVYQSSTLNKMFLRASFFFCLITFIYFIVGLFVDVKYSFIHLRDYIFPIILLIAVSSNKFSTKDISNITNSLVYSSVLVSLFGFMEYTTPSIRSYLSNMKGLRTIVGGATDYYDSTWMIMGLQRMVSFFDNPNQLGAYLAIAICFIFVIGSKYCSYLRGTKRILIISLLSGALLFTFSRTAYALIVLILFFLYYSKTFWFKKRNVLTIIILVICFFGIMLLNEDVNYVITSTLNGDEASSADRTNNVSKGFEFIFNNALFGCGLGTSDARSDKLIFTAESAQINLLVEEGLFGFIALVQMYLTLGGKRISKMYQSKLPRAVLYSTFLCAFVSVTPFLYFYLYLAYISIGVEISKVRHIKERSNHIFNSVS